ncbi:protein S-acyltransferase 10 isoform X2 [Manihot esculenta]|uniref:protein S-acyltransferase 10 isoform X2 n=1 Tax=Manihot esculenta TaxID=3983 RepID=UPI001CC6D138|nr:protein S-acyltransferase 10 isoform X2 [Manihot esculenta]
MTSLCQSSFNGALDRCYRISPCLANPARRSSLGLKVALVLLHLIYVGILFLFDNDLIDKIKEDPWYMALYFLLFVATLIQYFVTSGSSPGYVMDAMRALNEKNAVFAKASMSSKRSVSSKDGNLIITVDGSQSGITPVGGNVTSWMKLVLDMYPSGTSVSLHEQSIAMIVTNVFFNLIIIVFGLELASARETIVGFVTCDFNLRWYICGETALCIWTGILCVAYLKSNITKAWWKGAIMILLLVILSISLIFLLLLLLFHSYLILTNQTTYELVRRRRIPYLRGIPERVYPFSKGVCRNLYEFCCARSDIYKLERLPTAVELEEKSRPYTCLDFFTCRCC